MKKDDSIEEKQWFDEQIGVIKSEEGPTVEAIANQADEASLVESSHEASISMNPTNSESADHKNCLTRNFLQTFKAIFLKYLIICFGLQAIGSYEILRKIKKSGMYRQDVLKLFQEPDFKKAWQQMFQEKIHVKMLLESRVAQQRKEDYLSVVNVLEDAF